MFPKNSVIKQTARESLNGGWGQAILAVTVLAALCILPPLAAEIADGMIRSHGVFVLTRDFNAAVSGFMAIYFFFLIGPLMLGLLKMFWIITAGNVPTLNTMFEFFSDGRRYRLALKAQFAVLWRVLIAAVICFAPYIILRAGNYTGLDTSLGIASEIANLGAVDVAYSLGTTAFTVVQLIIAVSFMPLPFVLINRPDMPLRDLVADTKRIHKLYSGKYAFFVLSFFGWLLLSFLVLPLIFTLPFFLASWAVLARFSIFHASRRG